MSLLPETIFEKMTFEQELASFRKAHKVNLFLFFPIVVLVTIYCLIARLHIESAVATAILISEVILLSFTRRPSLNPTELRVCRYILRGQLALFALFLLYAVGVRGSIHLCPYAFLCVFLTLLVLEPKLGMAVVCGFVAVLAVLTLVFGHWVEHSVLLARVLPCLLMLAALVYIIQEARLQYREALAKAQSDLGKSEQEHRELSVRLNSELKTRTSIEKRLRQAHKMEAVGRLASGVAHDLNNILSGIVTYPELLLMDLPEDSPLRRPIQTIQRSGERAAAVVADLLALSRRGVMAVEVVDLREIVSEYLLSPQFERLMSYHPDVEVETEFADDLMSVRGSPVHLLKAIMNLAANAAEAMPDGGKMVLRLFNRYVDGSDSAADAPPEGEYVVLSVADSGIGMREKDIEHIFEPFYTKKVMGRSGSGLGMAVVWGTVVDHDARIDVKSAVGEGTTITIHFPATREAVTRSPDKEGIAMGNGECILVVDDAPEQREIATSILKRLGYRVTAVASGEDAVAYLERHSADLIVLDMIMDPGIDGLETYTQILDTRPEQRAIIASGYAETDRVKEAKRLGAGTYVRKPYTLHALGAAVQCALEKTGSAKS